MAINKFPSLIGQGFHSEKSPIWSTQIAEAVSGRERRRKLWTYPRWQFKVNYEVLRDMPSARDLDTLRVFFHNTAGRFAEFAYLDPDDNQATAMQFGVGTGSQTVFQLNRTVTANSLSFTEPVFVTLGTPNFYVNGTLTTPASFNNYGLVTFSTAPANGAVLTWTGQYMFLCRFLDDKLSPSQMMKALWSLNGLGFISVKR